MRHVLVAFVLLVMAWSVAAGEAVSSAFTLDLHYESSGEEFPGEGGTEVWGLSSRWMARTTTWATDSNNDGVPDWWEQKFGSAIGGLPANGDADGDGYSNRVEYNADMNPVVPDVLVAMSAGSIAYLLDTGGRSTTPGSLYDLDEVWGLSGVFSADTAGWAADSDKDGIPDWWESLYGLNPHGNDSQLDSDGDVRTNLEEYNAGTNPVHADYWTRGISVSDSPFATDTRVWGAGVGPSFDEPFVVVRVSNGFVCDTGGLYYDWDGDGIPNWWEARFSRDGSKTGLSAIADDDGDGFNNYGEFVAYTNPTNSLSKFVVCLERIDVKPLAKAMAVLRGTATAGYRLLWQSAVGRMYSVYATGNLADGFGTVPVATIEGTGEEVEYIPVDTSCSMFFKVTVELP